MHNQDIKHIDKDKFELVSLNEKIFDVKFNGKPRSFLQDALLRFIKNKVNLVATTIVILFVLLSIVVPSITLKDYESANVARAQLLPPRVPYIENLGILDGTIGVTDYSVDFNNQYVDEDGSILYYPKYDTTNYYDKQYIKKGSLTNKEVIGSNKIPDYVGGTNYMELLKTTNESYLKKSVIASTAVYSLNAEDIVRVNIIDMPANTIVRLYFIPATAPSSSAELADIPSYYAQIGADILSEGVTDLISNISSEGKLALFFEGTELGQKLEFDSVVINPDTTTTTEISGYNFSMWTGISIKGFGGSWFRKNAIRTVCSFKYYVYNRVYANFNATLSATEYRKFLADNPGAEEAIVVTSYTDANANGIYDEGDTPLKWYFNSNLDGESEDLHLWEIYEVTGKSKDVYNPKTGELIAEGNYFVMKDGIASSGFDKMPYYFFGTDSSGRDLFAEIWLSLRTSLFLGLIVSIVNIVLGVIYGAIEGYYGGAVDFGMERFNEFISSFPFLTILIILKKYILNGFILLFVYLVFGGWIGPASTTRIQFYRFRDREYVLASKTLGAKDRRLIFKHILPNGIGRIITSTVLSIPGIIFSEATISYLGLGIGHGATLDLGFFKLSGTSLGVLLFDGQQNMSAPGKFYLLIIPAAIILILMVSFNLFGNALRDAMNPSLRGQE
ncbi:MAG: ABC transporter permease [Acholeplasmatales bacterium]|jgi:ABC-type dipeptide/oligopeptide/nickel transport system permease subunit|nr:ABC transporter permease [Acholeplasmatales bacterium]